MPPTVRNAASREQVAYAERKAREDVQLWQDAVRAVLSTPIGRAFCAGLLERGRVLESVFHLSGSVVYYNAGRQDFGREIMAELFAASEDLYTQMEAETRVRRLKRERETAAVQTAPAAAGEEEP